MHVLTGTSGYSYKEWKGRFYPEKMKEAEMLGFYSGRFPTVEINNTFYRMPAPDMLRKWVEQTPETFTFVLKAPQTITHRKRLKGVEQDTDYLVRTVAVLNAFIVSHYIFRWRTAMNGYYMANWGRIRLIEGASQRVQDDTMRFSSTMESLGGNFIDSVMTLIAFLPILYRLSAQVTEIPLLGEVPWLAFKYELGKKRSRY